MRSPVRRSWKPNQREVPEAPRSRSRVLELRSLLTIAVILVLLTMVLVGCGGDAAPEQATTTAAGPTTSEAGAVTTEAGSSTTAAAPTDGKVYEFKLSLHNPADSPEDKFLKDWAKQVEEATGGRVKITVFPGSVLGNPTDGLTMVQTGICDILWSYTGFFQEFKATSVLGLPLLLPGTAQQNTAVFWDLLDSRPEILKEFEGLKLKLLVFSAGPTAILGSNRSVASVDDLKNLKVRVGGGPLTDAVVAWGGSPVAMPPTELYEALQKNVIDGYIFDPAGVLPYKVYEPVDYFLDVPFNANPLFTVMNLDKWNELPADLQEIIMTVSGRAASDAFAMMHDGSTGELWSIVRDAGKTVTVVTPEILSGFQPGADEAIAKWTNDKAAAGVDAAGLVGAVRELVQKNVK